VDCDQTEPFPKSTPSGLPPTRIWWTSFVAGSILDTVPSTLFVTQIEPPPIAMSMGPFPMDR
jgi:hypothetical protein